MFTVNLLALTIKNGWLQFKGVAQEAKMMCAWMKRENMLLDYYNISAPDELEDCQIIRCRTLEVMVTILEESSNFAAAVKSDNGVSASETDQGGNGNDITAASEAVKSTGYMDSTASFVDGGADIVSTYIV
jgi:hypothetical protein